MVNGKQSNSVPSINNICKNIIIKLKFNFVVRGGGVARKECTLVSHQFIAGYIFNMCMVVAVGNTLMEIFPHRVWFN